MSARKRHAGECWAETARLVIEQAVDDLTAEHPVGGIDDESQPDGMSDEGNRLDAAFFLFGRYASQERHGGLEYWLLFCGVTDVEGFRHELRGRLQEITCPQSGQ